MAKGFGVSPITNTIYYGTQDTEKHMWTGKKEDVTDVVKNFLTKTFAAMNLEVEIEMEFDETEFEIEILNDGSVVHDMGELVEKGIEFL